MQTTTPTTTPLPTIATEQYDRNMSRKPEVADRCERCMRPLTGTTGWEVETWQGADAIALDEITPEIRADAGYSGSYILGPTCGKQVPAAFRRKVTLR